MKQTKHSHNVWLRKFITTVAGMVLSPLLSDYLLLLYAPFYLLGYLASHFRREVLLWEDTPKAMK